MQPSASPTEAPATAPLAAPVLPPRRRRWPAVAVAAVAVIVVVLALIAGGVIRLGPSTSSNPADETFAQASGVAASRSGSVPGGPWFAFAGVALVTPVAVLEPATNLSAALQLGNCTESWIGGAPANVAIPATGARVATGAAAFWTFLLKNASNGILLETISTGTADAVLTLGGAQCEQFAGLFDSFPSGMLDSPAIIAAANAAGGASFLATDPNATQAWAVVGGVTFDVITTAPEWLVEYTSCSIPASVNAQGTVFNATVEGGSGVVTNHTTGSVDCALSAAVGVGLAEPSQYTSELHLSSPVILSRT
jgi:hypothetical protein